MHSSADRELLIRNVLEAVGARRNVMSEQSLSRELELLLREVAPVGSVITPSNGRYGGPWPVFLLWILWTWSEPLFTIRQIFPI